MARRLKAVSRAAFAALVLVVATACASQGVPLPAVAPPAATPAAPISFPRDAGPHDALTEWWYYTGHLQTADGADFGFEFTIFQVARVGSPTGYMAHFAVTDVTGQRFSHQSRYMAGPDPQGLVLDVQGWRLSTGGPADEIEAQMEGGPGAEAPFGLQLRVQDLKPPVLHRGGYIEYGEAGGSYYYSRTRLAVSGTLRQPDGQSVPVSGEAWMDHQWGNFVVAGAGGWDWYSLQLEDNSELMLYVLRAPGGETSAVYGSQVLPDGTVRDIQAEAVRIDKLEEWTSPHTGAVYPSGWRIRVPDLGLQLLVTPKLRDQELYFPGSRGAFIYWEGAVDVRGENGSPSGRGYVELTGYARPTGVPQAP